MSMIRLGVRFALFLVVLALVAEVVFRTVVPAASLPGAYQTLHSEIFRMDTTWIRSGTNTHGRFGLRPTTWHVNNAGWNSPYDYTPAEKKTKPTVALFGDSFVEQYTVSLDQHIEAYLRRLAGGSIEFDSFGRSGWYLEQYVALARYVDQRFAPDTYVILIDWHDIYDSLRESGVHTPYAWQVVADGSSFKELKPPVHYVMSQRSKLLRRSGIVRYVRLNLGLTVGRADKIEDVNLRPQGEAPTTETITPLMQRATDFMIKWLVEEHPGHQFVLVVDGDRSRIYRGDASAGPRPEFDALRQAARPYPNLHFLDLQPVFWSRYQADHRRFEGGDSGHWSPYGNQVVAEAIYSYLMANDLISGQAR